MITVIETASQKQKLRDDTNNSKLFRGTRARLLFMGAHIPMRISSSSTTQENLQTPNLTGGNKHGRQSSEMDPSDPHLQVFIPLCNPLPSSMGWT